MCPEKQGDYVGELHTIRVKPPTLFLLRLEPKERVAVFLKEAHDHRVVFEMDADGDVTRSEGQYIDQGGRIEVFEDERSFVTDAMEGEARRLMVAEFKTWDRLDHKARIDLQVAWLRDMMKRTEDDFVTAVGLPFSVPGQPRWDYQALLDHLQILQALHDEMNGLTLALESL